MGYLESSQDVMAQAGIGWITLRLEIRGKYPEEFNEQSFDIVPSVNCETLFFLFGSTVQVSHKEHMMLYVYCLKKTHSPVPDDQIQKHVNTCQAT